MEYYKIIVTLTGGDIFTDTCISEFVKNSFVNYYEGRQDVANVEAVQIDLIEHLKLKNKGI